MYFPINFNHKTVYFGLSLIYTRTKVNQIVFAFMCLFLLIEKHILLTYSKMIICDKISFRSIKQPIHQINRIIFLLIDNLGVHLRHLDISMTKQLRGRIEICTEC